MPLIKSNIRLVLRRLKKISSIKLSAIAASLEKEVARRSRDGGLTSIQTTASLTITYKHHNSSTKRLPCAKGAVSRQAD